jgi:hypothetical protein
MNSPRPPRAGLPLPGGGDTTVTWADAHGAPSRSKGMLP